jgi:hypothetical protein
VAEREAARVAANLMNVSLAMPSEPFSDGPCGQRQVGSTPDHSAEEHINRATG